VLFDYETLTAKPTPTPVSRINFYLVEGPDLAPVKLAAPMVPGMPMASKGSQPTDGKYLVVGPDEIDEFRSDRVARKYLRLFVQTNEMLYDRKRWCLWFVGASINEIRSSPLIASRLEGVKAERLDSPTVSVQQAASTPHLFTQIRQPARRYLALPEVSSENRDWIPGRFFEPDVIAGNKLILWNTDKLWHFGYLQSSLYMAWVRTYCGRLKSDFSLSPGLVYFPFPFVVPTGTDLSAIEAAAQAILDERATHSGTSLADLYDPDRMPNTLRAMHLALDDRIDKLYGMSRPTEAERMRTVLERYQKLAAASGKPTDHLA
jgi:hypothetical protein